MSKKRTHTPEPIPTRVAHAGWDDHRHFGYSVFNELAGHLSFTELVVLAVSGRLISPGESRMLDDLAAVMAIAEPRIFPLKLVRLISSYGRILPAYAAGTLYLEDAIIGAWTSGIGAKHLIELQSDLGDEIVNFQRVKERTLLLLRRERRLIGFGVPFRPRDERVVALRACVKQRGRERKTFWRLLEAVSEVLRCEKGLEPNIGIGAAAVCLDLGFNPEEIAPLATALIQNLILANAVEEARQKNAILRRLPDNCIEYVGKPPRISPLAIEKEHQ